MPYKVVITDYYYPTLEQEKKVFKNTDIQIYDCNGKCKTENDVIKYARDADAIITQFVRITKHILDNLLYCKIIVRYAVGLDTIDIEAATEKRIMIANVPDANINEVAEHTLALTLAILRKVKLMDLEAHRGIWSYEGAVPIYRVSKLTLGLIGFGKIGRIVAHKSTALGFKKVQVFDPYFKEIDRYPNFEFVPLENLLSTSDIISIHVPLTEETRDLINAETIELMKNGSYIINTSRGSIIREKDLIEALDNKKVAGACLDVLEDERNVRDSPLLGYENVIITPHMAWYSTDSIKEVQRKAAEQVKQALLEGRPNYWVNKF